MKRLKEYSRSIELETSEEDEHSQKTQKKSQKTACQEERSKEKVTLAEQCNRRKFHKQNSKYKTEMCKNFQMKGVCEFGSECCYAHGKDELKQKSFLKNNYKTRVCESYHTEGICKYGLRCQYFHLNLNKLHQDTL